MHNPHFGRGYSIYWGDNVSSVQITDWLNRLFLLLVCKPTCSSRTCPLLLSPPSLSPSTSSILTQQHCIHTKIINQEDYLYICNSSHPRRAMYRCSDNSEPHLCKSVPWLLLASEGSCLTAMWWLDSSRSPPCCHSFPVFFIKATQSSRLPPQSHLVYRQLSCSSSRYM